MQDAEDSRMATRAAETMPPTNSVYRIRQAHRCEEPAMPASIVSSSRREFLTRSAAAAAGALAYGKLASGAESSTKSDSNDQRALVAITMDLEMARNFPHWEDTHWDY